MKIKIDFGQISIVLFITFFILKLTHNIVWSWWWVTSPLWIPILSFFAICVIVIFFVVICYFLSV
jgi:hypothetical protein